MRQLCNRLDFQAKLLKHLPFEGETVQAGAVSNRIARAPIRYESIALRQNSTEFFYFLHPFLTKISEGPAAARFSSHRTGRYDLF